MDPDLAILRDRTSDTTAFRTAADAISTQLLQKMHTMLVGRGATPEEIVLVIVLRSGISMLPAAIHAFSGARVGVVGLKRDERTLVPHWYYENLPELSERNAIVILDPMLATGGSAEAVVKKLTERGAHTENIFFLGILAAPGGFARLSARIPKENIRLAAVDEKLTPDGFISPGLGDFGDRYFGYAGVGPVRS